MNPSKFTYVREGMDDQKTQKIACQHLVMYVDPMLCRSGLLLSLAAMMSLASKLRAGTKVSAYVGHSACFEMEDCSIFSSCSNQIIQSHSIQRCHPFDMAAVMKHVRELVEVTDIPTSVIVASDFSRRAVPDKDVTPLIRSVMKLRETKNLKTVTILGSDQSLDRRWIDFVFSGTAPFLKVSEARSADLSHISEVQH